MENEAGHNFPILFLVPAHNEITPGTTYTPGAQPSQAELGKQENWEQQDVKDTPLPDNDESSRGIFRKRKRGRPKGSKRAEENCSCSNCGSWRKTGLLSRIHICGQCGKNFPIWGHYKAHMMNHGSKRPHCCSECSKSFVRLEDLRRHFVTHGDFKFKCHKCDKHFFRTEHLRKHKKCERPNITEEALKSDTFL